jgi:hypothetical protein
MHVQAPVAPAGPVAQAQAAPEIDAVVRKRQMEREDALFEMEMAERKQRLLQMSAEMKIKLEQDMSQILRERMDMYKSLCPNLVIDDRAKIMFKDTLMNFTAQSALGGSASSQLAIGNGPDTGSRPMTISVYALSKGYRFSNEQLKEIGIRMAQKYRQKYGQNPEQHQQSVGGAYPMVNSYYEKDWDMLEEVIRQYVSEQESAQNGEQRGGKKKSGKNSGQNNGQKNILNFMSRRQEEEDE